MNSLQIRKTDNKLIKREVVNTSQNEPSHKPNPIENTIAKTKALVKAKQLEEKLGICHLPEEEQNTANYIESEEYKGFSQQQKFQLLLFIVATNKNNESKDTYGSLLTYASLKNDSNIKIEGKINTALEETTIANLSLPTIKYMTDSIMTDIGINIHTLGEMEEKAYCQKTLGPDAQYLDRGDIEIKQSGKVIIVNCNSYFNNILLGHFYNDQKSVIIQNKDFFNFCEKAALEIIQQEGVKIKGMGGVKGIEHINNLLEDAYKQKFGKQFTDYQKSHLKSIYGAASAGAAIQIENIEDYKVVSMRTGILPKLVCDIVGKDYDTEYKQTLQHEIQHTTYADMLKERFKQGTIKEPQMFKEKHLLYSTLNEVLAHMRNSIDKSGYIDFNDIKNNLISDETGEYIKYFEKDKASLSIKIDEIIDFIKKEYPEKHKENNKFVPNQEAINQLTKKCLSNSNLRALETTGIKRLLNTYPFYSWGGEMAA